MSEGSADVGAEPRERGREGRDCEQGVRKGSERDCGYEMSSRLPNDANTDLS